MRITKSLSLLSALCATTALTATPAAAQEVLFSGTLRGELIVTGNALGLDVNATDNTRPGVHGGVGAFIANPFAWAAEQVGTFPVGTTADWAKNGSSAMLDIPSDSGIEKAVLLWSCSSKIAGSPTTALDTPATVKLRLPDGTTRTVTPAGSKTNITLASTANLYYQRWADVTEAVRTGGGGTYTVSEVVGLRTRSELSACGWSLFAVYTRSDLPMRNLNLWNLGESVRYTAPNDPNNRQTLIPVGGFCTPEDPFITTGSMVVTALEGDARYTGDTLEIFDPFSEIDPESFDEYWKLAGPNNAASNFFGSQINKADGSLDDRGTFGSRNHVIERDADPTLDGLEYTLTEGARQGWDITTIPLNDWDYNIGILIAGQTETRLRIATAGDDFVIGAIGLSLDFDSPNIIATSTADRTEVYQGERVTYTFELTNDEQGIGDEVYFCVEPSPNLTFVPGSVTVDGAVRNGVTTAQLNPENCVPGGTGGMALGEFEGGESRIVTMQFDVNQLDAAPSALDSVRVTPSWRLEWTPNCAGATGEVDSQTGAEVVIGGVVLVYEMTANPTTPPALEGGDTLTYTLTVRNVGAADSRPGVTARIPIPTGTTYVPGSSTLNNVELNDMNGTSPYAAPEGRTVQNVGSASGVVAAGRSAVATLQVTIDEDAPNVVIGRGFVDPDGPSGPLPEVPLPPINTEIDSEIILDTDNDTIPDHLDNCPFVYNPQQENTYDAGGWNPNATDEGNACDDTDGDGLLDVEEDLNHNGPESGETDATKVDTDGDGLCDGARRVAPCVGNEDTDGDKNRGDWGNGEPSPIDPDTDKDGICDGSWAGGECRGGELDLGTSPINTDSDRDGLCDGPGGGGWDSSGCVGRETDPDGDHGLVVHTDPADADSDDDRLCDGFVNAHDDVQPDCFGHEDRDGDRDSGDWAATGDETDPRNPDTDGGTVKDGDEVERGTNPRDPCDDLSPSACEVPEELMVEGGGCAGGEGAGAAWFALAGLGFAAWLRRRRTA
jgi:uncharacterized repeat protein (TIGR01451 family)/MYXO-CTERM domain-containing protein